MASKRKPTDFNFKPQDDGNSSLNHSSFNSNGKPKETNSFARRQQSSASKKGTILPPIPSQSLSFEKKKSHKSQQRLNSSRKTTMRVTPKSASDESKSKKSVNIMATTNSPRSKNHWWQTWQFWGILLVLCSGGIGYTATSMLLRLPKTQSCSKVFWPVASASVRIYCAQTLAEEKSVESLLQAIALVEKLPEDHPLRNEINRNVEKWATAILTIGETKFQEGNLEAAIAIARQIPEDVEASKIVESQVNSWNEIWSDASDNYTKVEESLRKAQWSNAFSWAVKLTDSKNDYWATTKYAETIDKINISQEESITLDKAANQLNEGEIDSLLEAIAKAEKIPQDSYAYDNAQTILARGKEKLLASIDRAIARQEWSQLQRISYRIPKVLGLEKEVVDWQIIANAGSSASLNTVLGLEDAIAEIAQLEPDSPLYEKGQQLTQRWTLEIEDVKHIAKAKELARPGNIMAYNAAIVEINQIARNNPRYSEAQKQAGKWRSEIQRIEDRPIINRAKELALAGNPIAWRRALAEINLISSSSPLYTEAQKHARVWRANIETEEDLPILNKAIALGNEEEYQEAIATAQQIASGRALSSQAKEKIAQWRGEIQAEKYLQEAEYLANQNSPDSLVRAIRIIRQIPASTNVYFKVVPNVNSWSRQILDLAQTASYGSLAEGIAIARKVPSGTVAYPNAQSLIEKWENRLNPPPLIQKQEKSKSDIQLEKKKKEN